MGPLDSCKRRDATRSFCLVVVLVPGGRTYKRIAVLVDNCCACLVFCWLISVRFVLHFLLFYGVVLFCNKI